MTDAELLEFLDSHAAVVVHFSHFAVMREGVVFPDDLQEAIAHRNDWALSCCVFGPRQRMDLPGSVGIILKPTVASVLSVSNSDAGASTLLDGSENSGGDPVITIDSVAASLDIGSHPYNEWRVKGAEVIGIIVANPGHMLAKRSQTFEIDGREETIIAQHPVTFDEVASAFPDLPIYTMSQAGLILLRPAAT